MKTERELKEHVCSVYGLELTDDGEPTVQELIEFAAKNFDVSDFKALSVPGVILLAKQLDAMFKGVKNDS